MTASPSSIRVVLVDESPAHRAMLRRSLQADGDIVVVAEASTLDGAAAAVARGVPDVITMGVGREGGEEEAITRIMSRTPRPILVVAGSDGGPRSVRGRKAIVAGAASVLARPMQWDATTEAALRRRVRALRRAAAADRSGAAAPVDLGSSRPAIVAIAASTGGPSAVETVLRDLLGLAVAVLLVQHIDQRLVGGFTSWLEKTTGWPVVIAEEGGLPSAGVVTVGPGGRHLELDARGLVTLPTEPRSVHMPSADRLLASLATHAPDRVVAALLTGMGADGAAGLLALRQAGAQTIAQDEATSAVFGMARAAHALGAVSTLTPLAAVGPSIARALRPGIVRSRVG